MDLEEIDKIRQLTLIALVSDDELMDLLVLKGANALSLIYGLKLRASIDLDFSLERDFGESDIDALRYKFERLLQKTFKPAFPIWIISFVGPNAVFSCKIKVLASPCHHLARGPNG